MKKKQKEVKPTPGPRSDVSPPDYGDHEWGVRTVAQYTPEMKAKEKTLDHLMPFTTRLGAEASYDRAVEQAAQVKVIQSVELMRRIKGKWVAQKTWKRKGKT